MKRAVPLVLALLLAAGCKPKLPDYGAVPAFALTDQNEAPFGAADLDGRVSVVDFVFTSCQTTCPLLTQQMKRAKARLGTDGIQFVSISVDPDTDTPVRLREYADRFGADWTFLTGPREDVRRLVVNGFKTAMGEAPGEEASLLELVHGSHFAVVDSTGHIRGFFDANDAQGRDELDAAVRQLLDG